MVTERSGRRSSLFIPLLFSILALCSICAGIAGYVFYEPIISHYQPFFFCGLPAGTLALLFLLLSILSGKFRIRQIVALMPRTGSVEKGVPEEFIMQNREELLDKLKEKKKELERFLASLKEQHREGLLSGSAYLKLSESYTSQLKIFSLSLKKLRDYDPALKDIAMKNKGPSLPPKEENGAKR